MTGSIERLKWTFNRIIHGPIKPDSFQSHFPTFDLAPLKLGPGARHYVPLFSLVCESRQVKLSP